MSEDAAAIHQLIVELAIYERAEQEVTTTVDQLREDGFGDDAIYRLFVAEVEGEVVGMALWYEKYSTCLLYTSPSPRDRQKSRMPSSA